MASAPPPPGSEKYTSGYDSNIIKAQMGKTPETQAAFLLPYLKPGQAVLDCGSGPGGLSLGFARLVSPGGRLDGVDMDEAIVQKANANAEAAGFRGVVKFHKANVYSLPFEDNTYDVVTGWGLILYLSDPMKAIREMMRVLKPGGVIAFVAVDWGSWLYHPDTPGMVAAVDYFKKLMAKDGGDAHSGRKMKRMLVESGLELLHVGYRFDPDLLSPVVGADFLLKHIKDSVDKDGAIGMGWTTKEDFDKMVSALENEFKPDPHAVFVAPFCEVAGRKPK